MRDLDKQGSNHHDDEEYCNREFENTQPSNLGGMSDQGGS